MTSRQMQFKSLFSPPPEWVVPAQFPNLTKEDTIAIDLETYDPNLKIKGSGAIIQKGRIIGIAVASENFKGYYPVGHETGNVDTERARAWLQAILNSPATKVFHNAMYDVCWLKGSGYKVQGPIVDTMMAASVIDENRRSYTLDALGRDYLGKGKNESGLVEAGKEWGVNPKSEMYKLPPLYVGGYAEQDADLTFKLWKRLQTEISAQDLTDVFKLETDLFPCLVDMRFQGVRVNEVKAHQLKRSLAAKEEKILVAIKGLTGLNVEIWAARSIAKAFDKLKLPYDRTEKSEEPSFTKGFLSNHPHKLAQLIVAARETNKAHTTFIDTILKHHHNGRIHADINQLRSDDGGTVTGRFSYANPNLQQIPARNKDLGPLIRSLFIPEEGCKWAMFDYDQQEPRLVVHYASLQRLAGVSDVVEAYQRENVDFHQIVADMADIPRAQAKTINLGLFYGMGKGKLAAELGIDNERAEELFKQYHERVPFVKQLTYAVADRAESSGVIRTLGGRRCRFNMWQPRSFGMHKPLLHEEALKEYGPGIKRAFTYKALNKLIQGSAADMTKKSMLDLYKEGIVPHIQIHDELDLSLENESQAKKIINIMENAVELEIPNKVDYESGDSWGDMH